MRRAMMIPPRVPIEMMGVASTHASLIDIGHAGGAAGGGKGGGTGGAVGSAPFGVTPFLQAGGRGGYEVGGGALRGRRGRLVSWLLAWVWQRVLSTRASYDGGGAGGGRGGRGGRGGDASSSSASNGGGAGGRGGRGGGFQNSGRGGFAHTSFPSAHAYDEAAKWIQSAMGALMTLVNSLPCGHQSLSSGHQGSGQSLRHSLRRPTVQSPQEHGEFTALAPGVGENYTH